MRPHIKMEMVAVIIVVIRPQNRAENAAGITVDGGQELCFGRAFAPIFFDINMTAVFHVKPANINRIGIAVL